MGRPCGAFLDSRLSPRRVERGEYAFIPAGRRYLALNQRLTKRRQHGQIDGYRGRPSAK
jgi:hypothetical protein